MDDRSLARALAIGLTLAGGAGLVWGWRRTRSSDEPVGEWTCQCGQAFRFTGTGRHRIYWIAEASAADPVLDGACPRCERPLPAERDAAPAEA